MPEKANGQTRILEREIEHVNDTLKAQTVSLEKRFDGIAVEQAHQWDKINETSNTLTELRLTVKGIGTSAAIYATIGSIVGSAIVTTGIGFLLMRLLSS